MTVCQNEVGAAAIYEVGDWNICRVGRCLCCYCCFCQTDTTNYTFSGGDWVTGQPKLFFETFASALLVDPAGKITYKFAKLSRNFKNI